MTDGDSLLNGGIFSNPIDGQFGFYLEFLGVGFGGYVDFGADQYGGGGGGGQGRACPMAVGDCSIDSAAGN